MLPIMTIFLSLITIVLFWSIMVYGYSEFKNEDFVIAVKKRRSRAPADGVPAIENIRRWTELAALYWGEGSKDQKRKTLEICNTLMNQDFKSYKELRDFAELLTEQQQYDLERAFDKYVSERKKELRASLRIETSAANLETYLENKD